MNYDEHLKSLAKLGKNEDTVHVNLMNLVDSTVLRALGYINSEEDIDHYHINGQTVIPLTIKFKKGAKLKKEDLTSRKYG